MKRLRYSRLWWAVLLMLGGFVSVWLRRYLPPELASLVSDEFVAGLGSALGLAAVALKADDARTFRRRMARRGTSALLVLLLSGCGAPLAFDRCNATVTDHERLPPPAGVVEVRCSRRAVCREVRRTGESIDCDGQPLVEVER